MRSLYLLLGDPVAHSRSPHIHARAFALLGVDAVYAPCRVTDLPAAFAGLRALGVAGCNVTVPHKTGAHALCDAHGPHAARSGSVNCIVREGDTLVGHDTDGVGLLRALRGAGVSPTGARAVIVGAGGSARAAALALSGQAARVDVVNRTADKARQLASVLRAAGVESSGSDSAEALAQATLVVHCTTQGLRDEAQAFDVARLRPDCTVVDLVYAGATGETALLRAARARGLRGVDGIDVLVHQAVASLELWLRRPQLDELAPALRAAALEGP